MPELILPTNSANGDPSEILEELPAECCGKCKWYMPLKSVQNVGQCRRSPPVALVIGMTQDALGRTQPLIDGAFPAVRQNVWCGEFSCAKPN